VRCAGDIGSMRLAQENSGVMIMQRWGRSLETSVIKL
jgi:hypothetical protein